MKLLVILAIVFIASTLCVPQTSFAQSQHPVRYNDWVVLTVGPATVENAINEFLATNEFALLEGFEFLGVFVNLGPGYHMNGFAAMCADDNGQIYAVIFDSSGEYLDYYRMGNFWD
jgi:hypothetical protein